MLYNTLDLKNKEYILSKEKKKQEEIQEQEEELSTEENEVNESEESELDILKSKVKELEEARLRDHADFENLKKRYEKEKSQAIAYAQESFARDLLSVIDSLDSASSLEIDEENLKESLKKMKEGIELTIEQFKKVFEKHGIELVDIDEGFDPNFHEAIMQIDSDEHEKGQIVQVFQKGYKYKDRVLRPAMVSIAK